MEKGINVSLATDGPASNNNLDMFEDCIETDEKDLIDLSDANVVVADHWF